MIANFTWSGRPAGSRTPRAGTVGMMLRRGTGGYYVNGVVSRWAGQPSACGTQTTLDRITGPTSCSRTCCWLKTASFSDPSPVRPSREPSTSGQRSWRPTRVPPPCAPSPRCRPPRPPAVSIGPPRRLTRPDRRSGRLHRRHRHEAGTFITATAYRGAADPGGSEMVAGLDQLRRELAEWRVPSAERREPTSHVLGGPGAGTDSGSRQHFVARS